MDVHQLLSGIALSAAALTMLWLVQVIRHWKGRSN
jgi:hypothetical protein